MYNKYSRLTEIHRQHRLTHRLGGYWQGPRLGTPFNGEKISPITRKSNTIDNVKAKIDNVKAKIQDEEDWGPRSRPTLARRHDSN
jgi:hypothetical protein